jgi:phosphoserine phosphatase RsbU/P
LTRRTALSAEAKYRLLLDISMRVRRSLDLSDLLEQLIDLVRTVVPYDAAGVFVLKESEFPITAPFGTHLIAGMALRGFPQRPREEDPMLKSGHGVVGNVIRTGATAIVPDVRLDPRYVEGRSGTLSEIAVPIVVQGKVIGALNLESDRTGEYGEGDAELLQFISNAAATSIEKAILHRQLLERKRLQRQLEIAREVQRGLLPGSPPDVSGYDIAGLNIPNSEIGGDYFDYVELPEGQLALAVADVSGKGVPAALIMATFRAALRTRLRDSPTLERAMESVNAFMFDSTGMATFVTAVVGQLDPGSGLLTYCNCGHNPPLLLRSDGSQSRLFSGGMILGVDPETTYESETARLSPGDTLVLYTDGVVESATQDGRELGLEGLEQALRAAWDGSADEMLQSVLRATRQDPDSPHYADDFTLVLVRRRPLFA